MAAEKNNKRNTEKKPSVLVVTSIYPRRKNALLGITTQQILTTLNERVDLKIISPVSLVDRFKETFLRESRVSLKNSGASARNALDLKPIYLPYVSIPFFGRWINGYLQYRALLPLAKKMNRQYNFDLILCYWLYPDGYAVRLLSVELGIPYILTALGSDLNIMGFARQTHSLVGKALSDAGHVITVSSDLRDKAISIGARENRSSVIQNGVNIEIFHPLGKEECREQLQLKNDERVLLFVGRFHPVKGLDILFEALSLLKDDERPLCLLVGEGPDGSMLAKLADKLGIVPSVRFMGPAAHDELPVYLNAADMLCLPSRNEGCPNVILESLACGTPIVASRVGGVPELLENEEMGIMFESENPAELAEAIRKAFKYPWNREYLCSSIKRSLNDVARETHEVISKCIIGEG